MSESKNKTLLKSFMVYCVENPEQRFWQALRNWSGKNFIVAMKHAPVFLFNDSGGERTVEDTYYWEGKNG